MLRITGIVIKNLNLIDQYVQLNQFEKIELIIKKLIQGYKNQERSINE